MRWIYARFRLLAVHYSHCRSVYITLVFCCWADH